MYFLSSHVWFWFYFYVVLIIGHLKNLTVNTCNMFHFYREAAERNPQRKYVISGLQLFVTSMSTDL